MKFQTECLHFWLTPPPEGKNSFENVSFIFIWMNELWYNLPLVLGRNVHEAHCFFGRRIFLTEWLGHRRWGAQCKRVHWKGRAASWIWPNSWLKEACPLILCKTPPSQISEVGRWRSTDNAEIDQCVPWKISLYGRNSWTSFSIRNKKCIFNQGVLIASFSIWVVC